MPAGLSGFCWRIARPAFAATVLVLSFATGVRAQPLADKVPADAMVYAGWLGYDAKSPGFNGSHLQAVLDAGQVQMLFDETLPKILKKIGEKDANANEALSIAKPIVLPLLKHPSAIWIGKPEMVANQEPKPRAGIISQTGPDTGALYDHLDNLLKNAPQEVTNMVRLSKTADTVVVLVGYGNKGMPAAADSLSATAGFKSILPHAVPNASVFVYVDVEQFVATANDGVNLFGPPEIQKLWPKIRDAIGLAGAKHVVMSSGFDGKDWSDHLFVHAPEPRKGLMAMADPTPLSDAALKSIPMTATLAGATKLDVSKLVSGFRKAIAEVEPNATEQIDKVFAEASKHIGMDVQKDLIDTFGDEWVYYTDPQVGGRGLGGIVMINRLRDAAKAEKAFTKLETMVNEELAKNIPEKDVTMKFLTTKSGTTTIHYLGTPLISPAWAVKDGYLIVGVFPQIVAGAADHLAAGGKSILDNPGYQAMRKRLGVTNVSSVSFMDLPQTAPDAYSTWVAISRLTGFADMLGAPGPAMLMPPLNKLMPHLSPAGSVGWADKDGIHVKAISPFPGATLLASDPVSSMQGSAPLLMAIGLPAMTKAREQGNRIKSASNLRVIGQHAFIYANQNKGQKFPPNLAVLVKDTDLSPEVFASPRKSTQVPKGLTPEQASKWVAENSDYIYIGDGLTATAGPEDILAYENPVGLTEGIQVLFADCHVEWLPIEQAREKVAAQQAKRKGPAL